MRVKGATLQNLLLGLALLAGVLWNLAHASEIKDLRVSTGATATRAEIRLDAESAFQVISLANPDRLVVDLPGARFASGVSLPAPGGLVKAIRKGQPVAGTTRIVFDLASPVVALKPHFEPGAGGPRLVVEWPDDGATDAKATVPAAASAAATPASDPAAPEVDPAAASAAATSRLITDLAKATSSTSAANGAASTSPASPQPPNTSDPSRAVPESQSGSSLLKQGSGTVATGVPTRIATGVATPAPQTDTQAPTSSHAPVRTMQDVMRRGGLRPLVIAIDAGHGGQDSGARGASGAREKDVTLQIAKELARQVNATPGLKAFLTRDSDFFIPLSQRYQKARAQKADLFVSIHADAFTHPAARGSSVL